MCWEKMRECFRTELLFDMKLLQQRVTGKALLQKVAKSQNSSFRRKPGSNIFKRLEKGRLSRQPPEPKRNNPAFC